MKFKEWNKDQLTAYIVGKAYRYLLVNQMKFDSSADISQTKDIKNLKKDVLVNVCEAFYNESILDRREDKTIKELHDETKRILNGYRNDYIDGDVVKVAAYAKLDNVINGGSYDNYEVVLEKDNLVQRLSFKVSEVESFLDNRIEYLKEAGDEVNIVNVSNLLDECFNIGYDQEEISDFNKFNDDYAFDKLVKNKLKNEILTKVQESEIQGKPLEGKLIDINDYEEFAGQKWDEMVENPIEFFEKHSGIQLSDVEKEKINKEWTEAVERNRYPGDNKFYELAFDWQDPVDRLLLNEGIESVEVSTTYSVPMYDNLVLDCTYNGVRICGEEMDFEDYKQINESNEYIPRDENILETLGIIDYFKSKDYNDEFLNSISPKSKQKEKNVIEEVLLGDILNQDKGMER